MGIRLDPSFSSSCKRSTTHTVATWKSSGAGRIPDPNEIGSGKKQVRFLILVIARISSLVGLADAHLACLMLDSLLIHLIVALRECTITSPINGLKQTQHKSVQKHQLTHSTNFITTVPSGRSSTSILLLPPLPLAPLFPGGSSHPPNYSPYQFLHSGNLFFSNPPPTPPVSTHTSLHTYNVSSLGLTSSLFTSDPNGTMRNSGKPYASTTNSNARIMANSSRSLCLMFGGDESGQRILGQ